MTKRNSILRSVTLTVLAILFATLTADAAYKWTLSAQKRSNEVTITNYNSSVCGVGYDDVMFTVQSTSAAKPKFGWASATSETTVTAGTKEANTIATQYAQGSIAMDDNNHLVIGETLNKANQMTRYFYWTTPSRSGKTVSLSSMSNTTTGCMVSQQALYNCANDNTSNPTKAFRVSGNITNGGKIWLAPKGLQQFVVLQRNSYCKTDDEGFTTSSNRKYTFTYTANTTYASVCPYDGGSKALLNTGNAMYDITSIPSASGSVTGTEVTIANLTYAKNGPVMFILRGHKVLATSINDTSRNKHQAIYDVTDGVTAAKAVELNAWNTRESTAGWYSIRSVDSNTVDVYAYLGGSTSAAEATIYRVTAAHTAVTAPTVTATKNFNNSMSYTITVPSGTTVYYTTDGTTPSNTNGNSITKNTTKTISATTTVKAIAYLTGYDNKSSVVTEVYTKNAAATNVTYSPNGGTFYNATNVTLTSSSGSYVYYGINANPGSSYVTSGGSIPLDGGTNGQVVIKAIGKAGTTDYSDGTQNSSSTYTFKCGTPTITGAANGGSYVADSKTVTIAAPSSNATTGATYQYSTDGTNWTTGTSCTVSGLGSHTVYARAIKTNYQNSGTYSITFTLRKPAAPTISGTSPFDNSTTVTMAAGADGGTIYYTSGSSTPADPTTSSTPYTSGIDISSTTYFKAICVVNGVASDVTSATFTRNEALAAPTIMPTSNTYNNDLTATITAASGATIYYRVNGGAWQTYSSGISVTADNTTIEAYAVKSGNSDSPIASQTYNFTCLTPTSSPAAGIYNSVQSVTLSCGTTGATIHYTTDGSTPNSSSPVYSSAINVSTSMTIKAIAIKSGYTDSDVLTAEYVLNLNPSSNVTSPVLTSTPKYGTSVNNPDRDLARLDGNLTFSAADPTSNGWTLDKYVVTISDGTNYATTVSGANINAIEFGTESTTITACNFKVGSTYTATVFARYKKGEATYDMPVVSSDAVDFSFDTYSPTIAVTTYVTPRQGQYVWWEDEHEQHLCYFDSYRVELTIDDHPLYSPTNSVPVSYYELLVSKDKGKNWEVITDRTVNNLLDPTNYPATTYPEGQYSGVVDKDKYVGRYNGNYRFSDSKNKITMDAGTENEREINLWFYYVYDVTSKVGTLSITDDSQGDPSKWQYRINAVYGGSESVTVDGTTITPTTDNISTTDYSDAIQSEGSIIITGVDGVTVDRNVKEIRFFDIRGVRLNEAPSSGFYIEVKLMNDGSIRTNKRVAR